MILLARHRNDLWQLRPLLRKKRKVVRTCWVGTSASNIRPRFTDINLSLDPELCNVFSGESRNELLHADQVISLLNPIYLPCNLQHSLLVKAQNLLEDCLFKFGTTKMQEVVNDKGWNCAQCVELNDWVKVLRRRKDLLNNFKSGTSDRPLSAVLSSLVQLRHTAVHRQRVTALEVQLFLEDAEFLLDLLDDREAAKEISNVHRSFSDYLKDLSAHSNSNEEKLRVIAREKRIQVFQLQLEEHSASSRILAENQEFERNATAQFQQKTFFRDTTHTRGTSSSILFQDEECDRHTTQETFRFCASCVEDIQTRTRAVVESNSARTDDYTPTYLMQRLSITRTTEMLYHGMTSAPWSMLVLVLVLLSFSFGALLWFNGSGAKTISA